MNEVKNKIKSLVDKYELLDLAHIKKYTEEETKKDFILPLFEALGWNVTDKNAVTAEESQSSGRVDYGFYLDGRIKFYLEAKPIKADLQNEDYTKQAIRYSWNKGVDWAILTNFESLKVFYCQDPTQSLFSKLVFEIKFDEYIDRFDQLWLLSKDSFKANELDLYAQKHGKKMQKVLVSDQLYKHLNECRRMLIEKLGIWNGIKDQNLLDEGVQKLLDRLIFIRVAEDRGIEDSTLIPLVRAWENDKSGKGIYESMIGKFRELDEIYNSNLFSEHPFEKWHESPGVTEEVIKILQGKTGYYEYDFKVLPADVLGAVYENYLGHRLAASRKGIILDKDAKKRKEQGIYYTPTFIVDYIVRNALKPILDKCQSVNDLKKIKVLDPACGSGSFLIKALEVINEKYKEFGNKGDEYTKITILLENIYGVDLDEQAVEIARLNLLLSALETRMKLPKLDKNIKNGNSLISGSDEELQKYFGKNFRDKKPFNWEKQFPEVFKQGGFDVIVGNPPYIRIQALDKKEVEYFNQTYKSPEKNYDIYLLFLEKGYSLLNKGCNLGFILPHKFFYGETGYKMRNFLYMNRAVNKIVDFTTNQIFEGATTYTCLFFLKKEDNKKFYYKKIELGNDFKNLGAITFKLRDLEELKINPWNFSDDNIQKILQKIRSNKYRFCDITEKIFKGSSTGNDSIFLLDLKKENNSTLTVFSPELGQNLDLEKDLLMPFIFAEDVKRYKNIRNKKLLLFPYKFDDNKMSLIGLTELQENYPLTYHYFNMVKDNLFKRKVGLSNLDFYKYSAARSLTEYKQSKIMIPDMLVRIRVGYDNRGIFFHGPAIHSVVFKEQFKKYNPLFFLAILNSKLFWFFISKTSTALRGNTYRLTPEFLNLFCFPDITKLSKQQITKLVYLVDKMLILQEQSNNEQENSNKWNEIKDEINKLDKKIDEEVYKLYGLTSEEIAVVEDKNE